MVLNVHDELRLGEKVEAQSQSRNQEQTAETIDNWDQCCKYNDWPSNQMNERLVQYVCDENNGPYLFTGIVIIFQR